MIKTLFGTAAVALVVAATPASAQLLGGGGLGGSLGGSLGGTLGSIGGNGAGTGSLGGTLGGFPVDTSGTTTSRTSSHTDKSVNARKGRVSASNASSTDTASDNEALIGRIAKRFADQGRPDDNPEVFKTRLAAYEKQTAPLLPYYEQQGRLTEIDGMASIDQVAADIDAALGPSATRRTKRDGWPRWKRRACRGNSKRE